MRGGLGWSGRWHGLLGEKGSSQAANKAPSSVPPIRDAIGGFLEPLFRRFLKLGGDDRGLGEAERSGGAAQTMRVAAQRLDCGHVVARGDQPFCQLGDRPQLVTGSLQVLVPHSGGEPEVVDLGRHHGLEDITSLSFDLMTDLAVGLCATCRWVRTVTNKRGSVFYRCLRADTDARFQRYPPLPVLECPGYDRRDPPTEAESDHDESEAS